MKNPAIASRYARALYQLAKDSNAQDQVFDQLRGVGAAIAQSQETQAFLQSALVRPAQKVEMIEKVVQGASVAEPLKSFMLLLAKKNRFGVFQEIVNQFQNISDEAHGVTRGVVRSATVLSADERKRIESLVAKATKKQVVLTYKEDASLIGGMVAEVGSLTFDDSLTMHLRRINEQINRSSH